MKLKEIIDFHDKVRGMDFINSGTGTHIDTVLEIGDYLNQRGDEGKEIILRKMSEENFVKFVRMAKSTLITSMITQGEGHTLLLADVQGELDGYTHTIILGVLGALADEEVI